MGISLRAFTCGYLVGELGRVMEDAGHCELNRPRGCRFGDRCVGKSDRERTFAGARGEGKDAPQSIIRQTPMETLVGGKTRIYDLFSGAAKRFTNSCCFRNASGMLPYLSD